MSPGIRWAVTTGLVVMLTGLGGRADAVDEVVTALMVKRHIPGLSLAVIEGGKIVKARGYGVTDAELQNPERPTFSGFRGAEAQRGGANPPMDGAGQPVVRKLGEGGRAVTQDTLFQAGSISMPVTALGVLHLAETRRVPLDEDINRTLTGWEVPGNQFTKEQKVTLRRLLSHTAGITGHGFPGYAVGAPLPTLRQVLEGDRPANTPPIRVDLVPGSKWRYAGGGYVVLQQWVVDVSGREFPEFMQHAVLEPLGMKASRFQPPPPDAGPQLTAAGHVGAGRTVPGRWQVYPETAAGGLWTTPSDLARFAIAIQEAYAGRANPVISQTMTREMLTRQMQDDGLGVFLSGSGDTLRFDHGGRNAGFDAQMVAYVESGQGAVVMINTNDNSGTLSRVLEAIADAYQWRDYPRVKPPEPIEDKEPAVTAQVKQIFEMAQAGRVDRRIYTLGLAETIIGQLRRGLADEMKGFGAVQAIALVGRRNVGNNREYQYRITMEKETILVTCTFFSDGRIGELTFRAE